MATVVLTIDDLDMDDFKVGFLKAAPVPLDENGDPTMSENAWLKEWGRNQYFRTYRSGKTRTAGETAVIDENIVT
jgi:hypothetical protein